MGSGDQFIMATITFKTALINAAAVGDRSAVAAVSGKKIAVHGYVIMTDATGGTFRWESVAGGTALSGVFILPAGKELVLPFSEVPWFKTASGVALSMEVGAGDIDGHLIYSEVS